MRTFSHIAVAAVSGIFVAATSACTPPAQFPTNPCMKHGEVGVVRAVKTVNTKYGDEYFATFEMPNGQVRICEGYLSITALSPGDKYSATSLILSK